MDSVCDREGGVVGEWVAFLPSMVTRIRCAAISPRIFAVYFIDLLTIPADRFMPDQC